MTSLLPHTSKLPSPLSSSSQNSVILVSHTTPEVESHDEDSRASGKSRRTDFDERKTKKALSLNELGGQLEWDEWMKLYAAGKWDGEVPPPQPKMPAVPPTPFPEQQSSMRGTSEMHIYPGSDTASTSSKSALISPTSPAMLLEFYQQNQYFPAPKTEWESERLATMQRYGLHAPNRQEAIERICRVAKKYYQSSTLIVTLVFEGHQVLAAEAGWGATEPGPENPACRPLPYDASLCPHGLTRPEKSSTFVVPDSSNDWRFTGNPYAAHNGGTLGFYASANIHLPAVVDPLNRHTSGPVPETLPVGSICVIDNRPRAPGAFDASDKATLHDFADMIAREFELGFEQRRRITESEQTDFLAKFLDTTLVQAPIVVEPTKAAPTTEALRGRHGQVPQSFHPATEELRRLCGAHSAALLDLRCFRAPSSHTPKSPASSSIPSSPKDEEKSKVFRPFQVGKGTIALLGNAGDIDWSEIVEDERVNDVVASTLRLFYATGVTEFDGDEGSPISCLLPHSTTAQSVVPIFDIDGTATLLLILTSGENHFRFEPADRKFASNVGAVVIASLLRQRVLEADRAKLAFVSQISHDLRTPIHGIVSQIELIREFSSPSQLVKLSPLLDVADVCLESLRDVLDDTLDWTKISNLSEKESTETHERSLSKANLEELIEGVLKATWVRKQRVDLVSVDALKAPDATSIPLQNDVEVILESQERGAGWDALVDISGLKRVLLNLLGNSLKFTSQGYVKATLRELPIGPLGQQCIAIDITDTGIGMSKEFLRDGSMFTPFVQENSFANGAGLGLSICDMIIKRMHGKLDVDSVRGQGTTVRVTLPINFVPPSPDVDHDPEPYLPPRTTFQTRTVDGATSQFKIRSISAELRDLFTPGPGHILQTPTQEKPEFDFRDAVEATQASLSGRLGRIPSRSDRERGKGVLGEKANSRDLIDEASKLGWASIPKGPPLGSPLPGTASKTSHRPSIVLPEPFPPPSPTASIAPDVFVLIAEDNPIARNVLTKLLGAKGIAFKQAEDGVQAVDLYKTNNFNLFLCDVQMPNKDGLQASFEIREWEEQHNLPRCRIIALTGLSTDTDVRKALGENGNGPIDSWLVKGGKSMRIIVDEVKRVQQEVESARSETIATGIAS